MIYIYFFAKGCAVSAYVFCEHTFIHILFLHKTNFSALFSFLFHCLCFTPRCIELQQERRLQHSKGTEQWFFLVDGFCYIYIYLWKDAGIHLAVGHEAELMAGGSGEALGVLMCTPQWGLCRGWGSSDPLALQSQWISSSHTSLLFRKEKALFLNSNYFCDPGELAKVKKIFLCFQAVQNHK